MSTEKMFEGKRNESDSPQKKRKFTKSTNNACFFCRKNHKRCDFERPCFNCVRNKRECFVPEKLGKKELTNLHAKIFCVNKETFNSEGKTENKDAEPLSSETVFLKEPLKDREEIVCCSEFEPYSSQPNSNSSSFCELRAPSVALQEFRLDFDLADESFLADPFAFLDEQELSN